MTQGLDGERPNNSPAEQFRRASPPPRRWGGKFQNNRFLPRRKKGVRPAFGYAKPHGQES